MPTTIPRQSRYLVLLPHPCYRFYAGLAPLFRTGKELIRIRLRFIGCSDRSKAQTDVENAIHAIQVTQHAPAINHR